MQCECEYLYQWQNWGLKLFTVLIVIGGQHWWALAFSDSLPLYLYECICTVLSYSANKVSSSSSSSGIKLAAAPTLEPRRDIATERHHIRGSLVSCVLWLAHHFTVPIRSAFTILPEYEQFIRNTVRRRIEHESNIQHSSLDKAARTDGHRRRNSPSPERQPVRGNRL